MGTWGSGPFDNDTGADFAHTLDEAPTADREGLIRDALATTVAGHDYLDAFEAAEAVAAAALVATQCRAGLEIVSGHAPKRPLPPLSSELRVLALDALDRALATNSELAELWDESGDAPRWRRDIAHIRKILISQVHDQNDELPFA